MLASDIKVGVKLKGMTHYSGEWEVTGPGLTTRTWVLTLVGTKITAQLPVANIVANFDLVVPINSGVSTTKLQASDLMRGARIVSTGGTFGVGSLFTIDQVLSNGCYINSDQGNVYYELTAGLLANFELVVPVNNATAFKVGDKFLASGYTNLPTNWIGKVCEIEEITPNGGNDFKIGWNDVRHHWMWFTAAEIAQWFAPITAPTAPQVEAKLINGGPKKDELNEFSAELKFFSQPKPGECICGIPIGSGICKYH